MCDGAHPPFGQTFHVKPTGTSYRTYIYKCICIYTSAWFSKVNIPSKESVMHEIF